jgi:hypothetical protein
MFIKFYHVCIILHYVYSFSSNGMKFICMTHTPGLGYAHETNKYAIAITE